MLHTVKKTIVLLIAVLLTLSLAACGAEEAPVETGNQQLQASQNTTPSTEADPTESTGDVSVPTQTEPDTTQPTVTEPPVTEPIITEPVVTEPVVTEPAVTEPPVTVPPVTEPSVTEPVVTEPPATEPPVTEPPATQVPTENPDNYFYNENNNSVEPNAIVIKPLFVTWDVGGEYLVAECFVINGFDHDVYDITVNSLEVYNSDGLIASGSFGLLRDLGVSAGDFTIWRFVFNTSCVVEPNADLQTLIFKYNISNKY